MKSTGNFGVATHVDIADPAGSYGTGIKSCTVTKASEIYASKHLFCDLALLENITKVWRLRVRLHHSVVAVVCWRCVRRGSLKLTGMKLLTSKVRIRIPQVNQIAIHSPGTD
jgi:hypothetical protein